MFGYFNIRVLLFPLFHTLVINSCATDKTVNVMTGNANIIETNIIETKVYKFKKIVGRADFSDQFRKIIVRYKRIGYNINIMRQSACLVFNPIMVNNFASLFNCRPVGRASDSMMAPT